MITQFQITKRRQSDAKRLLVHRRPNHRPHRFPEIFTTVHTIVAMMVANPLHDAQHGATEPPERSLPISFQTVDFPLDSRHLHVKGSAPAFEAHV